jgi:iron(III) transport system permease protein
VSAVLPVPAAPVARFNIADFLARLLLVLAGLALAVFLLGPLLAIFVRAVENNQGEFVGLQHFAAYFSTPALARSVWNSVWVSLVVVAITVPAAFVFAYALTRSCMPFKGTLRLIALIPLLAPSLLPAIALIQWFGNQGALKVLMGGVSIYGAPGIIMSEVFNCFPHALMILIAALALADGRLY